MWHVGERKENHQNSKPESKIKSEIETLSSQNIIWNQRSSKKQSVTIYFDESNHFYRLQISRQIIDGHDGNNLTRVHFWRIWWLGYWQLQVTYNLKWETPSIFIEDEFSCQITEGNQSGSGIDNYKLFKSQMRDFKHLHWRLVLTKTNHHCTGRNHLTTVGCSKNGRTGKY